jgi:hypothetical protein
MMDTACDFAVRNPWVQNHYSEPEFYHVKSYCYKDDDGFYVSRLGDKRYLHYVLINGEYLAYNELTSVLPTHIEKVKRRIAGELFPDGGSDWLVDRAMDNLAKHRRMK